MEGTGRRLLLRAGAADNVCNVQLGKRGADAGEDGVNGRSYLADAGDAREGNQGYEQGILNQVLTAFTVDQALKLEVEV